MLANVFNCKFRSALKCRNKDCCSIRLKIESRAEAGNLLLYKVLSIFNNRYLSLNVAVGILSLLRHYVGLCYNFDSQSNFDL